jgi:hypothetical protein
MKIRLACGLAAAALFLVGAAEVYAQDEIDTEAMPISVAGCIQRETEYRRQNNSGRGGFLGFGGGLGDEYVLVNASRGADGAFGDCTTATGGEAYELTGSGEEDLEPFVGQRVAINGTRKAAEIDAATGRPTGGRQAGDDLRLFEVEVESFRALSTPVQTGTVTRLEQEPPRFEQEPPRREQDRRPIDDGRVGTAGARSDEDVDRDVDQLPRTASPLALTALMSLLSLAGVLAVRALQRHDQL